MKEINKCLANKGLLKGEGGLVVTAAGPFRSLSWVLGSFGVN